jgi:hypothetical protein
VTQPDEHSIQLGGARFERSVHRRGEQPEVARDDERVRQLAQRTEGGVERA